MVEPPATLDVGPSLALAGVGLVVGSSSAFYGSRQGATAVPAFAFDVLNPSSAH
jgi:hypothetical protein